ncbi:type II/IV secretion system protein [Candidatus Roizmanbacteria bacterium]|nr:type II/IV secretion system protein [Candidatus Roizmanbacteria bacterium]
MVISDDQLKALLLKTKLIDEKGLEKMIKYAKNSEVSLADALVENNLVSDENLGLLISDSLKLPFIVLTKTSIPPEVFRIVPERIARKHKVIAFARSKEGIKVAMADPRKTELLQLISKKTGERIFPYLATIKDINNTFQIYRKDLQKTFDELIAKETHGKNIEEVPIIKIVDLLINYAYQDKASDIHIEPQEANSLVRFRIDGVLHDMLTLPKDLQDRVISRIKVLSRLRTDEHLSAQDGKMRIKLEEETLDIRVSIIPIADGEKVVLRLLSSKSRQLSLIDLGMNQADLDKVTRAFNRSFGMILSTGPTGSGKSTTIYSILKIINTRDKNITTIEDPVEYKIKGINQIQVNPKTNLTFAAGLRSILRQDPNVIFVGEIRDIETAGIAVNAALTGHLVLSTLHTNDAATTLPRLTDMKVEPFLVASTVNIIVAQRLVRKICDMCRTSIDVTQNDLMKNLPAESIRKHFGAKKELRIYKGQGCKVCHFTGYTGRVGLFEILEVTNQIRKLITGKADSDVIGKQAIIDGMSTMLDDGLEKVIKGTTSIEEVLRVTRIESI